MSNITKKALELLAAIMKQAEINCGSNTDAQALEVQALYPDWDMLDEGTLLEVGDRVNYDGVLYNVLQEHQKQATWNPVDAPSLFARVLIVEPSVISEWVQPDSTNPYMKGDKVTHNGSTWESLVDNNVWEPGAVGTEALWKEVTE
jgi:hypothetical protein